MKWSRILILTLLIVGISVLFVDVAEAQCPMCRMTAEGNLKDGGTAGRGLNAGILYMLSMPYLIVMTIGYIWWRNNRKASNDEDVTETSLSNDSASLN